MVCKMVPGDNTPEFNDTAMICISSKKISDVGDEIPLALIVVRDMTAAALKVETITLSMVSTLPVRRLMEHVASTIHYELGSFELILQRAVNTGCMVVLNNCMDQTLETAGFACDNGQTRNSIIVADVNAKLSSNLNSQGTQTTNTKEEMTALPERDANQSNPTPALEDAVTNSSSGICGLNITTKERIGFVGLVNQAMTCYLNSLIQTLFMTPEFRNALYRWRFEEVDGAEEQVKSIPFQLQSLFLQLQTSEKTAIATTNLTRSFGWDSSEAWQQHDIQELCRVMFDALEHKFKNTEQSDLISRLYEGKMMDYVRCLECRTEKAREDTFLDIPLPVRPFGSQTAYVSIEEALKAFVTPEILDGNNQYWCDTCNKKCDAHKGLKFSRFPYLLTLHLKRFDFDYTTFHRVKLNDKVTFPEILNLDSFIDDEATKDAHDVAAEDSLSEVSESSRGNSSNEMESQDDDEGIDVRTEGGASGASCVSSGTADKESRSNSKNRVISKLNYELFSIMVHSGSASGGHYYAYIKDFATSGWYCFNDQTVTPVTYDDIRKTYGGGPSRSTGYFTSAYTSSTNAYMLMYRQIDPERNANFMHPTEFPPHVEQLLQRMHQEEESIRQVSEQEKNTCRIQLYCRHPRRGRIDLSLKFHKDITLREATSLAYEKVGDLKENGVPLERCRLVKYNEIYNHVDCSWDDRMEHTMGDILGSIQSNCKSDLLLEIVEEGQEFQVYTPGSIGIKVMLLDLETRELQTSTVIRMAASSTVLELKQQIRSLLNISQSTSLEQLYVVLMRYSNELRLLTQNDRSLRLEGFHGSNKIYVIISTTDETEFNLHYKSRFFDLVDRYENTITVQLSLPYTDRGTLDRLGISNVLECRTVQRIASPLESVSSDAASEDSLSHLERQRALSEGEEEEQEDVYTTSVPCNVKEGMVNDIDNDIERDDGGDVMEDILKTLPNSTSASASEDSSLSLTDSDRTLLGDPPEIGDSQDDSLNEPERRNATTCCDSEPMRYFFKILSIVEEVGEKSALTMIDKRIPLSQFKLELEALLNVPSEFLLVYKKSTASLSSVGTEREWCQPNETLETLGDDPQILVRLGRSLRPGEVRGKIYMLTVNNVQERSKFLFDWILAPGIKVGNLKRGILAEVKARYGNEIPADKCILRKKSWRTPSTVYGNEDDDLDTDILYMFKNFELFLQVLDFSSCEDVAGNYSDADIVIFARRWKPSTYTLEEFVNIPLTNLNRQELGLKLERLTGTPMEAIEVAKAPGTFPCDISLLAINSDLTWAPLVTEDGTAALKWPCNIQSDGDVLFWRVRGEEAKKLTESERKEILRQENGDLVSTTSYPSFSSSPRKERPLKIYLDAPPTLKEDNEFD